MKEVGRPWIEYQIDIGVSNKLLSGLLSYSDGASTRVPVRSAMNCKRVYSGTVVYYLLTNIKNLVSSDMLNSIRYKRLDVLFTYISKTDFPLMHTKQVWLTVADGICLLLAVWRLASVASR